MRGIIYTTISNLYILSKRCNGYRAYQKWRLGRNCDRFGTSPTSLVSETGIVTLLSKIGPIISSDTFVCTLQCLLVVCLYLPVGSWLTLEITRISNKHSPPRSSDERDKLLIRYCKLSTGIRPTFWIITMLIGFGGGVGAKYQSLRRPNMLILCVGNTRRYVSSCNWASFGKWIQEKTRIPLLI